MFHPFIRYSNTIVSEGILMRLMEISSFTNIPNQISGYFYTHTKSHEQKFGAHQLNSQRACMHYFQQTYQMLICPGSILLVVDLDNIFVRAFYCWTKIRHCQCWLLVQQSFFEGPRLQISSSSLLSLRRRLRCA